MQLTLEQRLTLFEAYDAQEPDAKLGMMSIYGLDPSDEWSDPLVKAGLVLKIERGESNYDGVLGWLRRAAVGMPVPGKREIESWRRVMRGAA